MTSYLVAAKKAALESGTYIRRNIGKIGRISYKADINLVTDVDRRAERIIVDILKREFPAHRILSEEMGALKTGDRESGFRWIIDPLDGTTNFAHGFGFFCVSIALEFKGDVITGVVYDPIRSDLFRAEKGKGAFLNNKRIRVSRLSRLKRSLLATGFAYNFKDRRRKNFDHFINFYMRTQGVRRAGSAALDICYVASGRFDGFWEMDLHPWDTAAAVLILKESGGEVSRFNGSPFSHYDKEILVSNGLIHKEMIKVLNLKKARCLRY